MSYAHRRPVPGPVRRAAQWIGRPVQAVHGAYLLASRRRDRRPQPLLDEMSGPPTPPGGPRDRRIDS